MKFTFAFEKLLEHKRQLEQVARRNWLEAQAKVDESMRKLDEMYTQIDDGRKRISDLQIKGGAHLGSLVQISEFILGQKIRIERHRLDLRELLIEAERLQEIVVEAAREKKTLDKLKERRFEEYKRLRKKIELKQMDELVVTRFKIKEE